MKKFVSLVLCTGLLVLACFSTGCSLCCAPYDYCGPVYANGGCANLARMRCGTAFHGGCATCGAHGRVQEFVNQNNPPVSQTNPQAQPATAPEVVPTPAPNVVPSTTRAIPAPTTSLPSPTKYQPASIAQVEVPQTATPTQSAPMPENGSIAVDASGYARVAVYDENNQLLGYEMVDSTGKSVNQVQAPASAQ